MIIKVIEGTVKEFSILERTMHNEIKTIDLKVQKDNKIYSMRLNRNEYGTYRDDNVSRVGNLLKIGMNIDLIEGEQGLCIGTGKEKKYYGPNAYIVPDVVLTIETLLDFKDVIRVIEDEGWNITKTSDGYEFQKHSPAGEDFSFAIELQEETQDAIFKAIYKYAENFDIDEHVELWVSSRGKNGVPNSITALVKDAQNIVEMLKALLRKIRGMERVSS